VQIRTKLLPKKVDRETQTVKIFPGRLQGNETSLCSQYKVEWLENDPPENYRDITEENDVILMDG
jgi:hypothetical protein